MIEAQIPLPLLLAAERMINQAVALDPSAKTRLAVLSGRVFEIHLTTPGFRLYITPTAQGELLFRRDFEAVSDAQITTSAFSMLRLQQGADGMDALFSGDIHIEGNQQAAESFLRTLNGLDIDIFALLAERIGVVPTGLIERRVMAFKKHFAEWRRTRQIEQADFLVHERRLLAEGGDVQTWMDDVDAIRDHVDQLAGRLKVIDGRLADAEART